MNNSDKTLVILAGGKSTRFGKIGNLIPKFLIPFNNTNLLQKQVDYAVEAGIKKIIISTSPGFMAVIEDFFSGQSIEIFSNSHHHTSSFSGLAQVIQDKDFGNVITVSLADIYFISNPFTDTIHIQTSLYLSQPHFESELERGGIVFVENGFVTKLVAETLPGNKHGLHWNGLCSLSSQDQKILIEYVANRRNELPEEDFFNHLLTNGNKIIYTMSVDFINNNSPQDLFLSGLYDFADSLTFPEKEKFSHVIEMVRKNIYKTS